jgi:hypothetical protein
MGLEHVTPEGGNSGMEPSLFGDDHAPNTVVTMWLKFELIYELWAHPLLSLKPQAICQIPTTRWMVWVRGCDLALPTILHATANVLRAPGLATDICGDKSLRDGATTP